MIINDHKEKQQYCTFSVFFKQKRVWYTYMYMNLSNFKELRVVFGVFISPMLWCIICPLCTSKKCKKLTFMIVHICDAQKHLNLYILALHVLNCMILYIYMILIDIWLHFSVAVNLGQKLLEALFEHWPRGYWFMENQGTIIVHKLSFKRNIKVMRVMLWETLHFCSTFWMHT